MENLWQSIWWPILAYLAANFYPIWWPIFSSYGGNFFFLIFEKY
jgi:hypothetical protein